jgi:sugar/nucleoside kinase (ribokinase family)
MVSGFLVIGDATIDVTVAPLRPLRLAGDVPATIRFGPGGQGANVAVRLARRGAAVSLLAAIGPDASGRLIAESLAAEGVHLAPAPVSRSSSVVALLDPSGERSMLSDRQPLPAAALEPMVATATWIHASAYALVDEGEGDALAASLGGRRDGIRLSVAGGSFPPVSAIASRVLSRLAAARPEVLLASRDEAGALLGEPSPPAGAAAAALAHLAPLVVVTAGSQGSCACLGGEMIEEAAQPTDGPTLDATGSGDAYCATLIAELVTVAWPPRSGELRRAMAAANRAGSQVARVFGAQGRIPGEATATGAGA